MSVSLIEINVQYTSFENALELAWMNNMLDFAFPYLLQVSYFGPFHVWCLLCYTFAIVTNIRAVLQFIREYTSKVDELMKDKIESQNEETNEVAELVFAERLDEFMVPGIFLANEMTF